MRHRARKTMAGTMAIQLARSNTLVAPTPTATTTRKAQGSKGHCGEQPRSHGTHRAARCASRCASGEPGRRGERPPLFEHALTDAPARRPSRAIGGRSPLRPGRLSWRASEVVAPRHDPTRRGPRLTPLSARTRSTAGRAPGSGMVGDQPPAITRSIVRLPSGPSRRGRFAPPAQRAASALTDPPCSPAGHLRDGRWIYAGHQAHSGIARPEGACASG